MKVDLFSVSVGAVPASVFTAVAALFQVVSSEHQ